MADKNKVALNRLTKKLSALRATLSKDERVLLDRIVLSTPDVVGHKMTNAASGAKKAAKVNEVAAHGMTTKAASGAVTGARKPTKVTEVALHGMTTGAASAAKGAKKALGASNAAASGAVFSVDATTGGYRINDGAAI